MERLTQRLQARELTVHLKAQIEELDCAVGQVLKTVEELQIEENTLVLFMSDNGGSRGTDTGPLRGGKGQSAYEGGRRTAFLAWWPGSIPGGKTSHEVGITIDLLPTLSKLCGGTLSDNKIDGRDISGMLLDPDNSKSPHEAVAMGGRAMR